MIIITKEFNEKIVKDMDYLNTEVMPQIAQALEENNIDMVSSAFYFAGVVKNILTEIDDKDMREVIIRYMLD